MWLQNETYTVAQSLNFTKIMLQIQSLLTERHRYFTKNTSRLAMFTEITPLYIENQMEQKTDCGDTIQVIFMLEK